MDNWLNKKRSLIVISLLLFALLAFGCSSNDPLTDEVDNDTGEVSLDLEGLDLEDDELSTEAKPEFEFTEVTFSITAEDDEEAKKEETVSIDVAKVGFSGLEPGDYQVAAEVSATTEDLTDEFIAYRGQEMITVEAETITSETITAVIETGDLKVELENLPDGTVSGSVELIPAATAEIDSDNNQAEFSNLEASIYPVKIEVSDEKEEGTTLSRRTEITVLPSSDKTASVDLSDLDYDDFNNLDLVVEGEGEIIGDSGSYETGSEIELEANSATGYEFSHWADEADELLSEELKYEAAIDEDKTVTAVFELIETDYEISVTTSGEGEVTGAETYDAGESVELEATAAEGYEFSYWFDLNTGEVISESEIYQIDEVVEDRKLEAVFELGEAEVQYPDLSEVEDNETMLQTFYWNMGIDQADADDFPLDGYYTAEEDYRSNYPEEEELWVLLADRADKFAELGITSVWVPPAHKPDHPDKVGYAVYDLWDLGEFEQSSAGNVDIATAETKHGNFSELQDALAALQGEDIEVYYDAVLNHRFGGAAEEEAVSVETPEFAQHEDIVNQIDDETWEITFADDFWPDDNHDAQDEVFLVGDINDWDPSDNSYQLTYDEDRAIWSGEFSSNDIQAGDGFKFFYDGQDDWRDPQNFVGVGGDPYGDDFRIPTEIDEIYPYTNFVDSLAGRDEHYSQADEFEWDWQAFNGVDYCAQAGNLGEGVLFEDKDWGDSYSYPFGGWGADVDVQNEDVAHELKEWGQWIIDDIGFDGFRLDAIAHMHIPFVQDWLAEVQSQTEKDTTFISEAWVGDVKDYLDEIANDEKQAFDFDLRSYFDQLSRGELDLSELSEAGMVNQPGYEDRAVTFLDNHDTSRDGNNYVQAIENNQHQAYAYILTRKSGLPTIYWKDYYQHGLADELDKMLSVREHFAYGEEYDPDNDDQSTYSYVRAGLDDVAGTGLVMMISDADSEDMTTKTINSQRANTSYIDYSGNVEEIVRTDADGYGDFMVKEAENSEDSWSIWVPVDWDEWN